MALKQLTMNNKAFTLVEILVSIAIFSMAISIASGIFVFSLRIQERILAERALADEISYAIEYISRAVRMAKKDLTGECLGSGYVKYNYAPISNGIRFLNYNDKCQEFYRDGAVLKMRISSNQQATNFGSPLELTSTGLQILSFRIGPSDSWDQDDNDQPRVTLFLDIQKIAPKPEYQVKMKIQTTISQRNPDIRR